MKGNIEFRYTRNGTSFVTKERAYFLAIRSHLDSSNFSYFIFNPKIQKPIKPVIRHLQFSTPAEDTSDGLVNFGFEEMFATSRSPEERIITANIPSS
jgi:hypothetical protein